MRASGCLAEADNVGEVNLKGFTKLLCFSHFSLPFGKLERVQRNCVVALVALVIQASAPLAHSGSCELALLLPQINAARNIDSTGKNSRWKHRTSLGLCTETRSFLHFMRFNQLWNDVLRVLRSHLGDKGERYVGPANRREW